jgi:hypothetical protein
MKMNNRFGLVPIKICGFLFLAISFSYCSLALECGFRIANKSIWLIDGMIWIDFGGRGGNNFVCRSVEVISWPRRFQLLFDSPAYFAYPDGVSHFRLPVLLILFILGGILGFGHILRRTLSSNDSVKL